MNTQKKNRPPCNGEVSNLREILIAGLIVVGFIALIVGLLTNVLK